MGKRLKMKKTKKKKIIKQKNKTRGVKKKKKKRKYYTHDDSSTRSEQDRHFNYRKAPKIQLWEHTIYNEFKSITDPANNLIDN